MKIRLLVIGSRPDDWVRTPVATYLERLPAHLKPELVEIPLSLRSSGGDPAVAKAKEGQRILQRLKPNEFVITLDERGKPWSSVELSRQMVRWQIQQPSHWSSAAPKGWPMKSASGPTRAGRCRR